MHIVSVPKKMAQLSPITFKLQAPLQASRGGVL